jgi:glycosyltransferase involved in cell wall biosynthesis
MEFLPQNVRLLIAGSGELENTLKTLTKEKKLENRVNFLGTIDSVGVASYLKESDVFCRPSLSEGLGNVFLEAMAANVPVVATKVGGIPDFLRDNETGWFCEVKNPQSIADKIKYILDDKNQVEVNRVKNNAIKMVEEKYNWDSIAEKMKQILI